MSKEAVFIVIDVGSEMYKEFSHSEGKSRLQVAIDCSILMVSQKIFNSKLTYIGLIAFGTNDSDKIEYFQEITKPTGDYLKVLQDLHQPSQQSKVLGGDIFDSIDRTLATIQEFCQKKKYTKRIFLITNGSGKTDYSETQLGQVMRQTSLMDVKLNVICLDFMSKYDPTQEDFNFEDDPTQTTHQNRNQKLLMLMKENLGDRMTLLPNQSAIQLYSTFRTKNVVSRVSYRGKFYISKDQDASFDICIYKKTSESKLPSLKPYSTNVPFSKNINAGKIQKDTITYVQDDPDRNPVEKENIIKGYYYGKQLVPMTETFEEKMKLDAEKCIKLLCFTDAAKVPHHMMMKDVDMMLPTDANNSKKGLQALVQACLLMNKVAIVRYVFRNTPKFCVLYPHKAETYYCFYICEIPTSESIRDYQFTSLKESTQNQDQAVEDLVEQMDLTKVKDEDGEEFEELNPKYVFNPTRQYLFQVVMDRYINKSEKLPALDPVIDRSIRPEKLMWPKCKDALDQVQQKFNFQEKEIKTYQNNKVFWKDLLNQQEINQIEEETGFEKEKEIFELANDGKKFAFEEEVIKNVGIQDPIKDFNNMINNKYEDLLHKALQQMKEIIVKFVNESLMGSFYTKALDCLVVLQESCVRDQEPEVFNEFLKDLKKTYSNGQHFQFWNSIVEKGITLISQLVHKKSMVTVEQAKEFMNDNEQKVVMEKKAQNIEINQDIMEEFE